MKGAYNAKRNSIYRVIAIVIGILINVLLALLMKLLGLPLYMDTIGTVAVTAIAGLYPGIFVAVISNLISGIFNADSMYFSIISAGIAFCTAAILKKSKTSTFSKVFHLILASTLVSGILSALIQWWVLAGPQLDVINETVNSIADATNMPHFLTFLLVNIVLNLADKGVTVILGLLLARMVPKDLRTAIHNSIWKQKPLSDEKGINIREWARNIRHSIQGRITWTLVAMSIMIIVAMGWICIGMVYNNTRSDCEEIAENIANYTAETIDSDLIDRFLDEGESAPEYVQTKELLGRIYNNTMGMKGLYVFRVNENKLQCIFDFQEDPELASATGDEAEITEGFLEAYDAIQAGEVVKSRMVKYGKNHVLETYYPVYDGAKNTQYFIRVDMAFTHVKTYTEDFLFRVALIVGGIFILIMAYGFWNTRTFFIYPVSTMADCIDGFVDVGDDQSTLDANVRRIRELDIHTGDETEKLYQALCDLMLKQAEQMRDIRYFTDATSKMQDGLIITMADMVESRDSDTGAHIQKTAAYVKIIAEGLQRKGYYAEKITPNYISDVVRSAPLHDVGKINISDKILNKPGKLNEKEYAIMKTHASMGKEIMEHAISTVQGESYLKEARNMAAYHHERWDGKGYPEGLHGEVIPLSARIMAVADVFDALTSQRVYKPAFPLEQALAMIEEGAGTQFDPKCVEVFLEALPEVKEVLRKYNQL